MDQNFGERARLQESVRVFKSVLVFRYGSARDYSLLLHICISSNLMYI